MKEYKVVMERSVYQKPLEEVLNDGAKLGWVFIQALRDDDRNALLVFEREADQSQ